MDDRDILKLERYIDTYLFPPTIGWLKDAFYVQIYSRWAAYEILERMINEISKPPQHISGIKRRSTVEIIDEFIDEMEYYYELSENLIFYVARNAAMNILTLFEDRKEN